nr:MAG TPA: hypothetical protein [Caudoviricetes sp.]DAX76167.1 MAG TPA: hypothetical protein [Caudoviricetes sp.]DAX82576.1 MAG TPA: hypothetical protein [Caudoviricetes sp.]
MLKSMVNIILDFGTLLINRVNAIMPYVNI